MSGKCLLFFLGLLHCTRVQIKWLPRNNYCFSVGLPFMYNKYRYALKCAKGHKTKVETMVRKKWQRCCMVFFLCSSTITAVSECRWTALPNGLQNRFQMGFWMLQIETKMEASSYPERVLVASTRPNGAPNNLLDFFTDLFFFSCLQKAG